MRISIQRAEFVGHLSLGAFTSMLKLIPGPIRGFLSLLGYTLNTFFWCTFLFSVALLKAVIPHRGWRRHCSRILNWIASRWIAVNNLNLKLMNTIRWDIRGLEALRAGNWYLVVSNHQSWVDILILQRIFHRRIPFLKFFIKQELIWMPVLGLAWWALDFPFVKRYSRSVLERKPHLKGKDLEITRKACRKFREIPVSIMNFAEGTRFTPAKHRRQRSPYAHLLRPRSGGIAFVLSAMGEQMTSILDVTIVYPQGAVSFWDMLCGRLQSVVVRVREIPVTDKFRGDYFNDDDYRQWFQEWLNHLWLEKDARIATILSNARSKESRQPESFRQAA
jgi:1-acyl-sn-glycerol-3-phosphate acyltransferase